MGSQRGYTGQSFLKPRLYTPSCSGISGHRTHRRHGAGALLSGFDLGTLVDIQDSPHGNKLGADKFALSGLGCAEL
jgi:hypothetical protein